MFPPQRNLKFGGEKSFRKNSNCFAISLDINFSNKDIAAMLVSLAEWKAAKFNFRKEKKMR
jgi:hypothetical protein